MRVLYVATWWPYPPTNGAEQRTAHLLDGLLAAGHDCHLFCLRSRSQDDDTEAAAARSLAFTFVDSKAGRGPLRSFLDLLRPQPRYITANISTGSAMQLREVLDRGWDAVVAYELIAAHYVSRVRTNAMKILDACEPFMFRPRTFTMRSALAWEKHVRYIRRLLEQFDVYTAVSPVEGDWLRETIRPMRPMLAIVPNGVDVDPTVPDDRAVPGRLIYAGSLTYEANHQAVTQFLRDVWPSVIDQVPSAELCISGRMPDVAVQRHVESYRNVHLVGLVSDYRRFVESAAATPVYLQSGGGTRVKVLEAMAWGCPVIGTAKALEGLDVADDRDVLLRNDPAQFAAALVRLITDAHLRERLRTSAHRFALTKRWSYSQRVLIDLLEGAQSPPAVPASLAGPREPVRDD